MKILYHIPFRHGLGADRWIYEGFRDAFHELGHEVFAFENHEKLERKVEETEPHMIITSQNDILLLKENILPLLKNFRRGGGKVFVRVGEDFAESEERKRLLREESWCDVYFTGYSLRVMRNFAELAGKACIQIPFAANAKTHFPVPPVKRYEVDLCFVGGYLPKKKVVFRKLLFPLLKKYRVLIFGPGWTFQDRALGASGVLLRRMKLHRLREAVYKRRVGLPADEERTLYSSAKISLNIHEYSECGEILGLSNEREFKIPAGGGFQLSDFCPGLEAFFVPDREIVIARDERDWFQKIEYYLTHEEERRTIQEAGTRRALRDHTYHHRAKQIIACAKQ